MNQIILIILIGLGVGILLLISWNIVLELRLRKFMYGKNAASLEETIIELVASVERNKAEFKHSEKDRRDIRNRLRGAIQGVHTVRFRAFKDSGGNQSFATALVDEQGNGAILSTLYSRERMSIFAKPIVTGASEFTLTEEEKSALDQALAKAGKVV